MKHQSNNKKKLYLILTTIGIILTGLVLAFFIYVNRYYHTDTLAMKFLEQDSAISLIYEKDYLILSPKENALDTGLIFYPGGKVEYTAYAPMLSKLTKAGYVCIIPKMPFNLAVFNQDAATPIMADFPEIKHWYLGGHSLGGAMAASYASKHSESLEGLILLGAYSTEDLSTLPLKVLSIYGSEDQVLNKANYDKGKAYLPETFTELCIEGGNHAYYGDYGQQKGDGQATISSEEQQQITTDAIFEMLNQTKNK